MDTTVTRKASNISSRVGRRKNDDIVGHRVNTTSSISSMKFKTYIEVIVCKLSARVGRGT